MLVKCPKLVVRGMALYCSLAIFIFSAVALVIPSGYSYGPILLLLGSIVFFSKKPMLSLMKEDTVFVYLLVTYSMFGVASNFYHDLPLRAYEGSIRFLLAIPVYFLLIACSPNKSYFWLGLAFGCVGAGFLSVYQKYLVVGMWGRSSGFTNAIQFGNIALLMAALLFCIVPCLFNRKSNIAILYIFAGFFGIAASFFSWARGGWLAIPIIIFILYKSLHASIKKIFLMFFIVVVMMASIFLFFSSELNPLKIRIMQTQVELSRFSENVNHIENTSVSTRVKMWTNGIDSFMYKPIFGWGGMDAIKAHYPAQWAELNEIDGFNHFHNEYIDALAKKGGGGFIVLMAMYLVPLYYFMGLMRTRELDVMPFATAGVVLILCVMVFGLTQCFLAHNSGTMVFLFYLVIIKAYCRNILVSKSSSDIEVGSVR